MMSKETEHTIKKFRDMLIILSNGTRLISRIIDDITDKQDKPIDGMYFLYEPYELIRIDDQLIMVKWIGETTDVIIPIPIREVVTVVRPDDDLLKYYLQQVGIIPKDEGMNVDGYGEDDEDDEEMSDRVIH